MQAEGEALCRQNLIKNGGWGKTLLKGGFAKALILATLRVCSQAGIVVPMLVIRF
ncbi:MAG TPA: hypothetical protein VF458_15630 [Ktedonobacteraceae bacterium]